MHALLVVGSVIIRFIPFCITFVHNLGYCLKSGLILLSYIGQVDDALKRIQRFAHMYDAPNPVLFT